MERFAVVSLRVTSVSAHVLGVDGGVCGGRSLAENLVGKHAGVLRALLVLPVEMAWAGTFRAATAHLSRSRAMGRLARETTSAARPLLGTLSGRNGNAHTLDVGQGRMDVWLLAVVAGMVSRGHRKARASLDNQISQDQSGEDEDHGLHRMAHTCVCRSTGDRAGAGDFAWSGR